MVLQKSQVVLRWNQTMHESAWFSTDDESIPAAFHGLTIPASAWKDMGCPYEVTVTIEPGDLLNG